MKSTLFLCAIVITWPFFALVAIAGPRERVDVAEAIVWAFQNCQPEMDSDEFIPSNGETVPAALNEPQTAPKFFDLSESEYQAFQIWLNERRHPTPVADPEQSATQNVNQEYRSKPSELSIKFSAPIHSAPGRLHATIFTGENLHGLGWCQNCGPLKNRWQDGNDRISLTWSQDVANGPQIYPAIRFTNDTGLEGYPAQLINGRQTYFVPGSLDDLLRFVRAHCGDPGQSYSSTGLAGTINARSSVVAAVEAWKTHIGATDQSGRPIVVTFCWRRTGGQTFPILHAQPKLLTCQNIFGTLGEFTVDAPGSRLPVHPLLLGYRRANGQLLLRGEVTIPESRLGLPGDSAEIVTFGDGSPNTIGPMTVWTIFTVIKDLVAILNPTCDLTLGGQVTAAARLDGDSIHIDFIDCPSIKLTALFTFDLGIKRVILSSNNVHVDFTGSRIIHSRDFSIN